MEDQKPKELSAVLVYEYLEQHFADSALSEEEFFPRWAMS